ncbi:NUDIX hydrolase [Halostreptopolyspora alba]|uniref:NUDIX domain-containing protein n=1 Tax=Halostreptopolyspora alba TaxID=2487137 RepID=A0A3N0E653_9ACTN|nr:NUDIX domain-containing protein [Nocardiopsaceae bacterium YIM 96095]
MSAGDGNGWVVLPDGTRRWGRYGASGLLLHTTDTDGSGHVLLQHRAWWSHQGDTWGMPGGAIDSSESAVQAALREFGEEVEGDLGEIALNGVHRQDHEVWTYDTVLARSVERRAFVPGNSESADIRWVPVDEVPDLRLLPAFGAIWPEIREALTQRFEVVVDADSVTDPSVTDPPLGATDPVAHVDDAERTTRLRDTLAALAVEGVGAATLPAGLRLVELHRWFPRIVLVTGDGSPGPPPIRGVEVVPASGSAADRIAEISRERRDSPDTLVVTARPEVRERLAASGASMAPPEWLHAALGPTRAALR